MSRQFKLDENLPSDVADLFMAAGYDIETVLGEELGGEPDRRVIEIAREEGRILVTLDTDFTDIRQYPPADFPGIWVVRAHSQGIENILALLRGALAVLGSESASKRLWIVEAGRVRIHE